VVASVHVMVSRDVDYMNVAESIRKVLHEFGVHSSTIQPEFGVEDDNVSNVSVSTNISKPSLASIIEAHCVTQEHACLIRCPPEACGADACCPPPDIGKLVNVDGEEVDPTA